ncbi:protein FAM219A [Patella vulgata]|uniref:protein FAM219A n=1 Tax=Patella vulgata TaxID=6465 RepID=UPI00217F27EE|nr:protein FAM219A [Patella vulgata]
MDSMEDSGIDSDQKNQNDTKVQPNVKESHKSQKKSSELQKKIDKHREIARKAQLAVDQQPKKSMLARNRVPDHVKNEFSSSQDQQPLVAIMSDSEEDEFDVPRMSKAAHKEITEQLIKDGYNLDLEPDDEDLDLIPPRPLHERCTCCLVQTNCLIQ